jgi:hypothetical protein
MIYHIINRDTMSSYNCYYNPSNLTVWFIEKFGQKYMDKAIKDFVSGKVMHWTDSKARDRLMFDIMDEVKTYDKNTVAGKIFTHFIEKEDLIDFKEIADRIWECAWSEFRYDRPILYEEREAKYERGEI